METTNFYCPSCRQNLNLVDTILVCVCGEKYSVVDGIPNLINTKNLDIFKETEQHFHDDLSQENIRPTSIKGRNSSFHQHYEKPLLDLPAGSTILEVACGTRLDSLELAQAGKKSFAIDISPQAVLAARCLAAANHLDSKIIFAVADAEHLPFADSSMDAVFVAASFHHFPNQLNTLREMRRVVRNGGYVICGVEPQAWPYYTIYKLLKPIKKLIRRRRGRKLDSIADDTTEGYTKQQLKDLFVQAGLEIVDIKGVRCLSELYDLSVRLLGRLCNRPKLRSWLWLDHILSKIDDALYYVPGVKFLFWHWNVISKVPHG